MKAEVYRVQGLSFIGKADSGHWVPMDGPVNLGGLEAGTRPLELFLIGLGGCTGMDVASILTKKRAGLTDFRVEVEADRAEEHPRVFTGIRVKYYCRGTDLKEKDVAEAIRLSVEKYCGAYAMLSKACDISHEFIIE
jgi:putative redox protein